MNQVTRLLINSRPAQASRAAVTCLLLGSCASAPLIPYSTQTPPLVLLPAAEAGVQDQRARFREIYCAVLAERTTLPDHRPCEEAITRVGMEPAGTSRPVDLGPAKRTADRGAGAGCGVRVH
jgi:hypothetical protein